MEEVVVYVFIKQKELLLEIRNYNGNDIFLIPGGGIEDFDIEKPGDYRENAMHREIEEEFEGKVQAEKFQYVGSVILQERKAPFHVYLITEWTGKMPKFIIENNKRSARVDWFTVEKGMEVAFNELVRFALEKTQRYINENNG